MSEHRHWGHPFKVTDRFGCTEIVYSGCGCVVRQPLVQSEPKEWQKILGKYFVQPLSERVREEYNRLKVIPGVGTSGAITYTFFTTLDEIISPIIAAGSSNLMARERALDIWLYDFQGLLQGMEGVPERRAEAGHWYMGQYEQFQNELRNSNRVLRSRITGFPEYNQLKQAYEDLASDGILTHEIKLVAALGSIRPFGRRKRPRTSRYARRF